MKKIKEQEMASPLRRKLIQSAWATPVVVAVTLPQHAQASPVVPGTTTVAPSCTVYQVGDTGPGGGLVFYTSNGGCSGLEAATSDQSTSPWGCIGTNISGTSRAIGTGAANTAAILSAGCNVGTDAANVASNMGSGWFLPSRDELIEMYTQLHLNGLGGFANEVYWSSSEFSITQTALAVFFGNASTTGVVKSRGSRVRAVRAF